MSPTAKNPHSHPHDHAHSHSNGNGNGHTGRIADLLPQPEGGFSGRKVIGYGFLVIMAVMCGLFVIFWQYRARYLEVRDFAVEVVPAVRLLENRVPLDVDRATWRSAIADTEAMLHRVLLSGMIDREELERLQTRWITRGLCADPATARPALAAIWIEMESGALPRLSKHPVPAILRDLVGPPLALQPLGPRVPPDVDTETWRAALAAARDAWVANACRFCLTDEAREDLVARWTAAAAKARPDTAAETLRSAWNDLPASSTPSSSVAESDPFAFPALPDVLK